MSEDYREKLYTIGKRGERHWVYPQLVFGNFFKSRTVVIVVLMAIYLLLPWIHVGGEQAVYLDIIHQKFVFFGSTFWATDSKFLLFVLSILALSLFFFTALFGRVWCGWACPETVFLEFLYRPIERLIEGNAAARMRLDKGPWSLNKIARKSLKLFVFGVISWILASTLLAYFVGQERLITMMQHPPSDNPFTFGLTIAFMGLLLFQFGWFREQFCTVLCPYARFQSVLIDPNSIIVGYDPLRGEPRGKGKRNTAKTKHLGDCVDCGLCVRVCPTGIDIRNGLQLECIQCAACIDACNSIMDQIDKPRGLIRYDSEATFIDGSKTRWIRPRVLFYGAILAILCCIFLYSLSHRSFTDFQILRARPDTPYSLLADNMVMNQLRIRVSNKNSTPQKYSLSHSGPVQIKITSPLSSMAISGSTTESVPLFVNFPKSVLTGGKRTIAITLVSESGFKQTKDFTLIGPGK